MIVRGWPGAEDVTQDQAEEYYGTRFAKEALALDPTYAPAQKVLLSLTLDKGAVRAGQPPGKETNFEGVGVAGMRGVNRRLDLEERAGLGVVHRPRVISRSG